MTVAFELAGMVVAITFAAAFICWDADRLHDRAARDWYRRLREPGLDEATANFLWRVHRDREFILAMWITTQRDFARFNDLLMEALSEGSPSVDLGSSTTLPPADVHGLASHAPLDRRLRVLPSLTAFEVSV